ncbi:MAG: NAD(P)-binding domain-containing protein [Alphaproteobacteria bacterium]|nr:NAD(P)-binding domain-containing protein [Alphaproteobacteria bacterium]MBV9861959.1 NAD(P)-binding domain-containing protein [Alphaproteobacteria bacterium]
MAGDRAWIGRREMLRLAAGGAAMAGLSAGLGALPRRALAQGGPNVANLKIGLIGSGREGGALGTAWAKAGHQVMFSSRHPEELKGLVEGIGSAAQAGTVEQAVGFGDVVVVVVPYTAMADIGKDYGKALAQKPLVMDVSNPIPRRDGEDFVKSVNDQGGPGLVTAKLLPGAHIVRAFNAIGSARVAEGAQHPGQVGVPIAGDDQNAIAMASGLIRQIGFEPVLVGGLAMGKYLVPGTPLGGEHSPAELRTLASNLH